MKRNDTKRKENYGYSIKLRMQRWFCRGRFISWDIQSIIMAVLTALTIVTTVLMGFLIYSRFKMAIRQTAVANTESVVESAVDRLEADLLNVRQISNAVNYNIIQEYDISSQEFERQFSLLYEINTDKIQSMALYDNEGNLVVQNHLSTRKRMPGQHSRTGIGMQRMRSKIFIFPPHISRICSRMERIGITGSFL